jgi:hypothetical protein
LKKLNDSRRLWVGSRPLNERGLFLAPTLIAIAIVLMRFAFRIGNHFGFSDGVDEDLQGYDANFGVLIDERYPFRVIRLSYNVLIAARPSAIFPPLERFGS